MYLDWVIPIRMEAISLKNFFVFLKNLPKFPYYYCQRFCKWLELCLRHATSKHAQWWYPFVVPFWLIFWVGLLPNPIELFPVITFLEIPDLLITLICINRLSAGLPKQLKAEFQQAKQNFWNQMLDRPCPIKSHSEPPALPIIPIDSHTKSIEQESFLEELDEQQIQPQSNDNNDDNGLKIKFIIK